MPQAMSAAKHKHSEQMAWANVLDLVIEAFVWLILAFTPLLVNVYNEDAYRTIQALFLTVLATVVTGLWVARVSLTDGWRRVPQLPIFWGVLGFDLWNAGTCFHSTAWSIAFQSLLEIGLMSGLYFSVVQLAQGAEGRKRAWRLVIPALFGLMTNVFLGVLQYYHFDFMAVGRSLSSDPSVLNYFAGLDAPARQAYGIHGSAAGVLGNQNVLADYMIGAMPLLLAVAHLAWNRSQVIWKVQDAKGLWEPMERWKWVGWLALLAGAVGSALLSLVCLYMTITSGAWIAFTVTCLVWLPLVVVYFWHGLKRTNPKVLLGIALSAVVVLGGIGGVAAQKQMTPRSVFTFVAHKEHDFDQRVNAWKVAGLMLQDAPLTGQGLATYKILYFRFLAQEFHGNIPDIMHHRYVQAHDDWIQLAGETGVPGFLLALGTFLALLIGVLRRLWRRELPAEDAQLVLASFAGMLAIALSALFGFPFHIAASGSLFVILAGITSGLTAGAGAAEQQPGKPAKLSELQAFVQHLAVPGAACVALLFVLWNYAIVPFQADVYTKQGMDLYKAQRLEEARAALLDAVAKDPDRGDARMLLGMTFAMTRQFPLAAYHLERAERSYDDVTLHYYLGIVDESMGRLEKAKQEFEIAESYFPPGYQIRGLVIQQLAALDKRLALQKHG